MNLYNPVFLGPVTLLVGSSDRQLLKEISMKMSEALAKLVAAEANNAESKALVAKINVDISTLLTKIDELVAAGQDADLPEDFVTALNALGASSTELRDSLGATDNRVEDPAAGGEEQQPS